MKSTWSRIARAAFIAVIAAAALSLASMCRRGVEMDLYALLDTSRQNTLRALADHLGGQLRIILEGPDLASLDAPAAEFKAHMGPRARTEQVSITNTLATLASHSGGLLTDETRALLLAGKFDEVATNSATALTTGFLAPFVSVKQDPYLLATDYLMQLQRHVESHIARGWSSRDGDLVCKKGGRCYRLLVFDGFKTSDSEFICGLIERVHAFNRRSAGESGDPPPHSVKAYMSGTPFHTALSMEHTKRDITVLSVISLVFVFALGVWLFRSGRFVVPLLATLASALLVAAAAVFAVFGKPHAFTFVFGTSLIGLGVDYVYHACAAKDVRALARPLFYALLTTLACFAPLAFSSVAVLRQMALFTCAGLVTAWAAVMVWRAAPLTLGVPSPGGSGAPPLLARPAPGGSGVSPLLRGLMLLLLLAVGAGSFRIRFSSDPALFYRPDPFLKEGEKKIVDLNQRDDELIARVLNRLCRMTRTACGRVHPKDFYKLLLRLPRLFTSTIGKLSEHALARMAALQFVVVEGTMLQEALEREEEAGVKGLSAIIPSLKRQRENQALIAALREKTHTSYVELTGMSVGNGVDARGLLDPEEIDDPLLKKLMHMMCMKAGGRVMIVSPGDLKRRDAASPRGNGEEDTGVTVVDLKREVAEMFDAYAQEAYRLLGISFVLLAALLAALFRRRFLACAGPVLAAAVATLGVLGWCGVRLTFFHALCFFVCTGLGLDYVIFHLGNPSLRTRRVVFVSFLTSAVSFGMLAFTSFPVTRAMGTALALGLFFVYLFSSCMGRGVCGKLSATHEEKR